MLLEPGKLRRGPKAMIEEEERAGRADPGREAKLWPEKLQEAEQMWGGYQDLAARGFLTFDELGDKLATLEETRSMARQELELLKGWRACLYDLKRDRDTVLEAYANVTLKVLVELTREERNCLCKILKVRVVVRDDGTPEVSGLFCSDLELPSARSLAERNAMPSAFST